MLTVTSFSMIILLISISVNCVNESITYKKQQVVVFPRNTSEKHFDVFVSDIWKNHSMTGHKGYLTQRQSTERLKLWKRRKRSKVGESSAFYIETNADIIVTSEKDYVKLVNYGILQIESNSDETQRLNSNIDNYRELLERFKKTWPVEEWKKIGWFSEDYLLLLNPHWLQFSPPLSEVYHALGGLYIIFVIVGCSGNALVVIMYIRCPSLRTPGNILVVNLALSDFLMMAKTPIFIFNSFNLGPALGKIGCTMYGFLGGLSGTTSIATLAAISLDRYWAVVKPLEPLRSLTNIRARFLAIAAWLYAGIFSSIPALDIGYGRYVPEGYLTSCSFDYLTDELPPRYFIFVFFCAAWLLPFCIISFCYLNIIRVVLYKRDVVLTSQQQRLSSRHIKEQVKRKSEVKLATLVIAVIALFFLSWTPYAIVALIGIFGRKELITPIVSMVPALFCKTAACINPFIYIITHPKFRKELRKLLNIDQSERLGGTIKSFRYTRNTEASQSHRHRASKSSITSVEVIEVKDIPYQNNELTDKADITVRTVAATVAARERYNYKRNDSMKSFEEKVVSPPSWFVN